MTSERKIGVPQIAALSSIALSDIVDTALTQYEKIKYSLPDVNPVTQSELHQYGIEGLIIHKVASLVIISASYLLARYSTNKYIRKLGTAEVTILNLVGWGVVAWNAANLLLAASGVQK